MNDTLEFIVTDSSFTIISYYGSEDYFTVIPFDQAVICKGEFFGRYQTKMPDNLNFFKARIIDSLEGEYAHKVEIPRLNDREISFSIEKGIVQGCRNISFTFGLPS
jgi:hypothetical protein